MDALLWLKSMAIYPEAVREFQFALQTIQSIMIDSKASREEKRQALCMMVNELSEDTFKLKPIVKQILTIINMKEDICREYADGETQTNGILGWLPRMREHRDLLFGEVKKHRRKYRLDV